MPREQPPLVMSPEFQLIHDYFQQKQNADPSVIVGIGDDCALIQSTPNTLQAISVDTSIVNRHFPEDADPFYIAARALNVSLSDLAAMGATARWFTLAISLPKMDAAWLSAFSDGLFYAAKQANISLIGGDTTQSPVLTITVQVQGEVPNHQALTRSGAKIGDTIYVSGELGNAAAGLYNYQRGIQQAPFYQAYLNPQPQLVLGQQLIGLAHSCIDISDGLLADLGHVLTASRCAAEIDIACLPINSALIQQFGIEQAIQWALTGGDDYQLCFTSPLTPEQLSKHGICATAIGKIVAGSGYTLHHLPNGITIHQHGFDHFYAPPI